MTLIQKSQILPLRPKNSTVRGFNIQAGRRALIHRGSALEKVAIEEEASELGCRKENTVFLAMDQ